MYAFLGQFRYVCNCEGYSCVAYVFMGILKTKITTGGLSLCEGCSERG